MVIHSSACNTETGDKHRPYEPSWLLPGTLPFLSSCHNAQVGNRTQNLLFEGQAFYHYTCTTPLVAEIIWCREAAGWAGIFPVVFEKWIIITDITDVDVLLLSLFFLTCGEELSERPILAPVCRSVGLLVGLSHQNVGLSESPKWICKVLLIY